jgi:MarR family transcriptional regulator, organic hydroperoxide resistance regulator
MHNRTIGTNIGRVFRVLRTALHRSFEEAGYKITLEQWLMLVLLKIKDGQTQHDLSVTSVKEKTTITRLIDGLEKKHLIVRIRDNKDRRNNLIYLTQDGRKIEEILTPLAFKVNEEALKGFSSKEIQNLDNLLNKIYTNLS